MFGFPFLTPAILRLVALGLAFLAFGAFTAYRMHKHDQIALNALQSEYDTFKGGVAALGKAAEVRTKAENAANLKRKQDADKENADAFAVANRTIASLRRDADRARGSFVPGASSTAKRPDLACFDRVELESAVRGLVTEVRGFVDEGGKATLDLNTARVWAAGR